MVELEASPNREKENFSDVSSFPKITEQSPPEAAFDRPSP